MDKPWKVICAFIGVFVAGAVFGGLLAMRLAHDMTPPAPAPATTTTAANTTTPSVGTPATKPPAANPQQNLPAPQAVQSAQVLRRLTNQINLTRAQRDHITPFIDRAVQDFWRQQQNINRENAFLLQRLRADVNKELTPEQQARLDDLWTKWLDVFRKRQAEAQAERQAAQSAPKSNAANPNAVPAALPNTPEKTPVPTPPATPKSPDDEKNEKK
jgi:hypothetical protein